MAVEDPYAEHKPQLIETMAKAAFNVTNHYHPFLKWDQAHPETKDMYLKQAEASYDALLTDLMSRTAT